MTFIKDHVTIADVENQRSVQPLIDYLRSGQPLTDTLRQWLIALLGKSGNYGVDFTTRPGRRLSKSDIARRAEAHERVTELRGKTINGILIDLIAKRLGLAVSRSRSERAGLYESKILPMEYKLRSHDRSKTHFEFVQGKRISEATAIKIASKEFRQSPSTIKKWLLSYKRAIA